MRNFKFQSLKEKFFDFNKLNFYISCILIFLLPITKKIIPILIVMLIITFLRKINLKKINFYFSKKNFLEKSTFFLIILFYIFHIIGMFYTEHLSTGFFDLEVKLSIFIFPILFFFSSSIYKKNIKIILNYFILGNFFSVISILFYGFFRYLKYENINFLFYADLSIFHHPSYFAMYLTFCIAIIFYLLNKKIFLIFPKYFYVFCFFLFTITLYLLSSKAGILIAFIISFLNFFIYKNEFLNKKQKFLFIFFILFFYIFAFTQNYRIKKLDKDLKVKKEEIIKKEKNSASRLLIWESAFVLIKENFFFGVGTGDIKSEIFKVYKSKKMKHQLEKKLNVHNQFLETFVGQGFFNFLILIILFLISLKDIFIKRKFLNLSFLIIIGINFLFESMLNSQAGVVFFAFFYSFLNYIYDDKI